MLSSQAIFVCYSSSRRSTNGVARQGARDVLVRITRKLRGGTAGPRALHGSVSGVLNQQLPAFSLPRAELVRPEQANDSRLDDVERKGNSRAVGQPPSGEHHFTLESRRRPGPNLAAAENRQD